MTDETTVPTGTNDDMVADEATEVEAADEMEVPEAEEESSDDEAAAAE